LQQLFLVLDRRLPPRLSVLSDRPEGSLANPFTPDRDTIGTVTTETGPLDLVLERSHYRATVRGRVLRCTVVRLQSDRGHRVIDSGPYGYVRHPGYAGMMVAALTGGVVLGSWWSAVPMLLFGGMVVRRLAMEDRFLNANLDGYRAYSGRVRSKVLPGVW